MDQALGAQHQEKEEDFMLCPSPLYSESIPVRQHKSQDKHKKENWGTDGVMEDLG